MLLNDSVQPANTTTPNELLSFEKLFKLYHRRVYAVCLRMTGNTAEAEDLTQEVFMQVFRKLETFRGESTFTTWLYRLTVNQVLMYFRKSSRKREKLTEEGELPEISGEKVLSGPPILDKLALDEAILKLAPGYRAVIVLHDVQGLQHFEIATILNCSVGTSKSQLHKARMKLRRLLMQPAKPKELATSSGVKPDSNRSKQTFESGALSPLWTCWGTARRVARKSVQPNQCPA